MKLAAAAAAPPVAKRSDLPFFIKQVPETLARLAWLPAPEAQPPPPPRVQRFEIARYMAAAEGQGDPQAGDAFGLVPTHWWLQWAQAVGGGFTPKKDVAPALQLSQALGTLDFPMDAEGVAEAWPSLARAPMRWAAPPDTGMPGAIDTLALTDIEARAKQLNDVYGNTTTEAEFAAQSSAAWDSTPTALRAGLTEPSFYRRVPVDAYALLVAWYGTNAPPLVVRAVPSPDELRARLAGPAAGLGAEGAPSLPPVPCLIATRPVEVERLVGELRALLPKLDSGAPAPPAPPAGAPSPVTVNEAGMAADSVCAEGEAGDCEDVYKALPVPAVTTSEPSPCAACGARSMLQRCSKCKQERYCS
jgi:hypothetical protein